MTHKQIDELFDQYAHFVADGSHMRDILSRKDFHDLMKDCYPERTMPELERDYKQMWLDLRAQIKIDCDNAARHKSFRTQCLMEIMEEDSDYVIRTNDQV